jgi:hypothetical protein
MTDNDIAATLRRQRDTRLAAFLTLFAETYLETT